jgi:CRISPR-associated protein Csx1
MDTLIYQTLGKPPYDEVSYQIHDQNHGEWRIKGDVKFLSQALYSHYAERGCSPRIVFLYPNSLSNRPDDPDSVMREARERISEICGDCDFDVLIVNSIGRYRINGREWVFENTPGNISVQVFLDMRERTRGWAGGSRRVVVDISTGHNLYVVPILDALRALLVYSKLKSGVRGRPIEAYYAASDPIIKDARPDLPKRVFLQEYDVKAFFELPIKGGGRGTIEEFSKLENYIEGIDGDPKAREGIHRGTRAEREGIKGILENLVLMFNSIKLNAPLFLYTDAVRRDLDAEGLEGRLAEFFKGQLRPMRDGNRMYVQRLRAKGVFNLFFSIALYDWMAKKMGEIGDRAFAGEMKGAFMDIYDQFGLWLNKMFLKRDIEEMEARKEWIKEGWTPLSELLESGPESSKEAKILSNEVRNFFAHSGLGKSVVEVRKCGEDIELRYKRDRLNEVREWLIKSMG